jgi:hypothetical protein
VFLIKKISLPVQHKIICNFMVFDSWLQQMAGGPKKFSHSCFGAVVGSGIRDPGSGMDKNQYPESGINIPDPQHCYVILHNPSTTKKIPGPQESNSSK